MKKKLLLFPFLVIVILSASAQEQETVFEYSGLKLTGIWGGPAYGLTPLNEDNVFYRGGFGGLEFNKALFIAYASYWLDERLIIPEYPNQRLDFNFKGALLAYSHLPHKTVHPKIAFLIGGGQIDIEDEEKDKVLILQPSAGIEINVFKWWHIDILGGYRVVSNTDLEALTDQTMSSFQAEVKLSFGISWGWQ